MAAKKTTSIRIKAPKVARNANISNKSLLGTYSKRWIFNFPDSFSKQKEKLTASNCKEFLIALFRV
jgi:hypothetical protein